MIKLGILLIILSIIVLIGALLVPEVVKPFAPLFCKEGETLRGETGSTSTVRGTSISTAYFCVDKEGQQRRVTDQVTLATTLVFLVVFFAGLGFILGGAARLARKTMRETVGTMAFGQPQVFQAGDGVTVVTSNASTTNPADETVRELMEGLKQGVIRMKGMEVRLDHLPQGTVISEPDEKFNLTDALQQLENARASGLITEDEYQKMRKKILERFG